MNEGFGPEAVSQSRVSIVRGFAASELFERTFGEGMELVETVAAYLDGTGRQDSRLLSRESALAYAAESMRLTTRLMQVASWLLVQRAVREGDMSPADACESRYRLAPPQQSEPHPDAAPLPEALIDLCRRAERLYERVAHLDRRMYVEDGVGETANAVQTQFDRLQQAFG